jgi:hypothetical protein
MELSSAAEEYSNIILNPKFYYSVRKSPPLIRVLSQINPVHTTPSLFPKIDFNVTFPGAYPTVQSISYLILY